MRSWPDTASPTPTISTAHFGKVAFSTRHTAIETCPSTRCTSPPHLQSTVNPSLQAFRRDAAALIADSPAIVLVDGLWFSLSPPALCLPPAHPPHMHRQGASVLPSSSTSNRWHLSTRHWHRLR